MVPCKIFCKLSLRNFQFFWFVSPYLSPFSLDEFFCGFRLVVVEGHHIPNALARVERSPHDFSSGIMHVSSRSDNGNVVRAFQSKVHRTVPGQEQRIDVRETGNGLDMSVNPRIQGHVVDKPSGDRFKYGKVPPVRFEGQPVDDQRPLVTVFLQHVRHVFVLFEHQVLVGVKKRGPFVVSACLGFAAAIDKGLLVLFAASRKMENIHIHKVSLQSAPLLQFESLAAVVYEEFFKPQCVVIVHEFVQI
mmetsp:Transcript_18625/g.52037  ORF Transcript_18625/g.52037 Transcript_18625/m.52037 type:complete len:247 (+) Transcript_18625:2668-3408(+)